MFDRHGGRGPWPAPRFCSPLQPAGSELRAGLRHCLFAPDDRQALEAELVKLIEQREKAFASKDGA